jgi:hypothetical protein
MGMYTDWFIANEADAKKIAKAKDPWKRWPNLSMKSILEIELTSLYGILLGKRKFDANLSISEGQLFYEGPDYDDEGNPIGDVDSETIIVHRVMNDFVKRLAELTPENEKKVADKWTEIDEFADWKKSEKASIRETLTQIIEFARRALKAKKPVLELAVF